jgi:hypothetical protein
MICRHPARLRRLLTAGRHSAAGWPRWGLMRCNGCGKRRLIALWPPGAGGNHTEREIAEPTGNWYLP